MIHYVVKCRQGDDDSIARRASAAEAIRLIEQASGQGWDLAEITCERLVIDEAMLRHNAERERRWSINERIGSEAFGLPATGTKPALVLMAGGSSSIGGSFEFRGVP